MFLKDYILTFAEITKQVAKDCYPFIGKGDGRGADRQAVSTMRTLFNKLPMDIRIVIGEGERDQAPRLYTGERLGEASSDFKVDVAVDPLEGTTLCSEAREGALSVMAVAKRGQLFQAPDIYMNKIASGPKAKSQISLKADPKENIEKTAQVFGKKPEDITVGVLNRFRHKELIQKIREAKAKVKLVGDGDVALSLETALESSSVDLLMGIGGAPEGILSATALKCLNGGFEGQLVYYTKAERERVQKAGVRSLDKVWKRDELVPGEAVFCATAVTDGSLLKGIRKSGSTYTSHTLILTQEEVMELKNTSS